MGSAFIAAAALLLQGVATDYWVMIAGQFLLGLGVGGTLSIISAYIGRQIAFYIRGQPIQTRQIYRLIQIGISSFGN